MSGWPDPARPGTPLHPERDGWHWVGGIPREWLAQFQLWQGATGRCVKPETYHLLTYGGPCLTPSEVSAQRAAAWCAGRDAAERIAKVVADDHDCADGGEDREMHVARMVGHRIAALTPPPDLASALAQAVERARVAEREACAGIVERVAIAGTVHLAAAIRQRGAGGSDGG